MSKKRKKVCHDCGLPYSKFGLDTHLPPTQWRRKIKCKDDLCANCIMRRAKKVKDHNGHHEFTVAYVILGN